MENLVKSEMKFGFNQEETRKGLEGCSLHLVTEFEGVVLSHNDRFRTPNGGAGNTYSAIVAVNMDNGIVSGGNGHRGTINVLCREGYIAAPGQKVKGRGYTYIKATQIADGMYKRPDLQIWVQSLADVSLIEAVPVEIKATLSSAKISRKGGRNG